MVGAELERVVDRVDHHRLERMVAGGDQLDREGGVGRGVQRNVKAGVLEVSGVLGGKDPGVVRVRVPVEGQAEGLGDRVDVLGLGPAGGNDGRDGHGEQ